MKGCLILTNRRVSFIVKNRGNNQYDFFLVNPVASIKIIYSVGIPLYIKIPHEDICIKVKFPFFWRKQIMNLSLAY